MVFNGKECLMVVFKDVTERKRTEEALRESDERYRQMAENIREVFWMADLEMTRMLYISPGYEDVWGRSRASLYADPTSWARPYTRPTGTGSTKPWPKGLLEDTASSIGSCAPTDRFAGCWIAASPFAIGRGPFIALQGSQRT